MIDGDRTVILGLSCDYHDAAAALVIDGEVVAAAEEERFSRVKHDRRLPRLATEACLRTAGIDAGAIDHVVFYEKPLLVLARFLASRQRIGPSGLPSFVRDMPVLLRENLLVGYRAAGLLRDLGHPDPPRVQFLEHHRSHAGAAFLASPFQNAAILTVDGIGEWATASIGHGIGSRIDTLEELRYPNSLGLAYSFVTAWCGFEPNDGEYKVMGLAPYGVPRYREALDELIGRGADASLRVDARALGWFSPDRAARRGLGGQLGGPPREPDGPITQRELDLAASIQSITEDAMLALAGRAHELTGRTELCMAGGVALNCVANGRILREGPFERIWVQPASGDAGSAVGAALVFWHEHLGRPRLDTGEDRMGGACLGPAIEAAEALRVLGELGLDHEHLDEDALLERVAEVLDEGGVVGWVQDRMEFGPRALGNRSILADPRNPTVRQRLNELVKGRESFRPFAPAVQVEHCADWFDLDADSPYMLLVAPVRPEHRRVPDHEPADLSERAELARSDIPACTHVDGSARVQTVDRGSNPRFWSLIEAFRRRTDCPILVNTSFNLAGEPIVADASDAVSAAARGGMDLLVIGDFVVDGSALADHRRRLEARS